MWWGWDVGECNSYGKLLLTLCEAHITQLNLHVYTCTYVDVLNARMIFVFIFLQHQLINEINNIGHCALTVRFHSRIISGISCYVNRCFIMLYWRCASSIIGCTRHRKSKLCPCGPTFILHLFFCLLLNAPPQQLSRAVCFCLDSLCVCMLWVSVHASMHLSVFVYPSVCKA